MLAVLIAAWAGDAAALTAKECKRACKAERDGCRNAARSEFTRGKSLCTGTGSVRKQCLKLAKQTYGTQKKRCTTFQSTCKDCCGSGETDCSLQCGDRIVAGPEQCDPPGSDGQCAGGEACGADCRCPAPHTTTTSPSATTSTSPPVSSTTTTAPVSTTTSSSAPTTSLATSTTTSTSTTVTVTSTTLPANSVVDFQVGTATGNCGSVFSDTAGTQKILDLRCADLNLGGGGAAAPPGGPFPDGSISRFGLANCSNGVCDLVATDESVQAQGTDCTNGGCRFGLPLPIFGSPVMCVLNSFAAPASGTINLATGETSDLQVNLASHIFPGGQYAANDGTGNATFLPCPVCVNNVDRLPGGDIHPDGWKPVAGTPAAPGTGVCSGGPRAGDPCTSTSSGGLTHDCLPGGICTPSGIPGVLDCEDEFFQGSTDLGSIAVDLSPLGTGTASLTPTAQGLFCQDLNPAPTVPGCFNAEFVRQMSSANGLQCRHITADGAPFGDVRDGMPKAGRLASVFCIPTSGSALVDTVANLPSAGEVTLPGTLTLRSTTGP